MGWTVVVLVLCTSILVSCIPDNLADNGDNEPSSGRGAYLAEDREDSPNLRNSSVTEERTVTSEQRKDGIHHTVTITKKVRVPYTVHVEKRIPKIIEVPVDKPFNVYVPKPYPVIVERKVPYEIKVPLPQPYTVEKKVPYPVKVLVDKPYTLHVPKPYPVEVEKKIEFEVEKKVPVEVKVPVERRYPVHVIVEKEVKFPVEKKVPFPVKVPHDKPIPIHVTKHVPVHVDKPVSYTVEKVATYPVNVPFRIPIKVHYPEGGSMDELYSNSFSAPELQNLEWSEAMTSASKALRSYEENHFRSPVNPGFSSPAQRGLYSKNAYAFSQSAKGHRYYQNHHNNFRTPTKLQPISLQTTYEVNEVQPPTENIPATPFLSKPDSEIIVPQLLIGSPPQQSTNMLLSQAALASIVQTRSNDAIRSHPAPPHRNEGPSFTISHSVQHDYRPSLPTPPTLLHQSPATHQFHHISNPNFHAVQSGKLHPSNSHGNTKTGDGKTRQNEQSQTSQVPSATFFRPAPQNVSNIQRVSFPKLISPTAEGLRNHQTVLNQNAAKQTHHLYTSSQHHTYQDGATTAKPVSATLPQYSVGQKSQFSSAYPPTAPSPNVQPPAQQQHSGLRSKNGEPNISTSFIGSKTSHGGQELVYTASIQHNTASRQ